MSSHRKMLAETRRLVRSLNAPSVERKSDLEVAELGLRLARNLAVLDGAGKLAREPKIH